MNILGYSERGLVNALLYDIAKSPNATELLRALLHEFAVFPFTQAKPIFDEVDVYVEQSFSDFGDADALVLTRNGDSSTCAIFIEAKVKTFQAWDWQIADEFALFRVGLNSRVSSSNLFTQLYHKWRMVTALKQDGIAALKKGIAFPAWSTKQIRRIGDNEVVLEATRRLESHLGRVFYLSIVPDTPLRVEKFFPTLKEPPHPLINDSWDVSNFGYLTWSQVSLFCERQGLSQTTNALKYNSGQIYRVET